MAETKHTPGPWVYSFESVDPEWGVVTLKSGLVIANVNADHRQEANARLIAAAPEMLEALKKAKDAIRAWHGPNAWEIYDRSSPEMKAINEAIVKAVGRS